MIRLFEIVWALLEALFSRKDPILLPPSSPPKPSTFADRIYGALLRKGYKVFKGDELNIVYVEGANPDGTPNDNDPNVFNDLRIVFRVDGDTAKILGMWEATTGPGHYWTRTPMNPGGAARIAFGQYSAWQVGIHGRSGRDPHEALVQTGGPVTVCRDANKDYRRDGDRRDTGFFGINQHWGYDLLQHDISYSSAGCLVGRKREGHREFMALIKTDPRYRKDPTFVFTTAIIPVTDL